VTFFAEYQKFSQTKGHSMQSFEKPVVLKVKSMNPVIDKSV